MWTCQMCKCVNYSSVAITCTIWSLFYFWLIQWERVNIKSKCGSTFERLQGCNVVRLSSYENSFITFLSQFTITNVKIKGILPDFISQVLSKILNFYFFFHLFVSLTLRSTYPLRNWTEIISVWNKSNFIHNFSSTRLILRH